MKFLIALTILISTFLAHAQSQIILKMTNDLDTSFATVTVNEVDGQLHTIRITEEEFGSVYADATYTYDQLIKGVVVKKKESRNIINIRLNENFDLRYGGVFVFDYLSNGINNARVKSSFDLGKNGDAWEVSKNAKSTKLLHIISRKILGQVVGIERLVVK